MNAIQTILIYTYHSKRQYHIFCSALFIILFTSPLQTSARSIYVNTSSYANDKNNGLAADMLDRNGPIKSANKALEIMMNGDTVYWAAGNYFLSGALKKNNVVWLPYGDGEIIFSSASHKLQTNPGVWEKIDDHKNPITKKAYTTYKTNYPDDIKRWDTNKRGFISTEDDKLFWSYSNLLAFQSQYATMDKNRGVYFGTQYIYLAWDQDPNQHPLNVTTQRIFELYKVGDFSIDGGPKKQFIFKNGGRYNFIINNGSIGNITIKNCQFINGHNGLTINQSNGTSITVDSCSFISKTNDYPWEFIKNGPQHTKSKKTKHMNTNGLLIAARNQGDVVVTNSSFHGYFNGLVCLSGNTTIHNNSFAHMGDDAIEIEGNTPDVIVSNNTVASSVVSISLTPIEQGPVYVFENIMVNKQLKKLWNYDFKKKRPIYKDIKLVKFTNLSSKVSRDVHVYYNTFIAADDVLDIGVPDKKQYSPHDSDFYNNIFYSNGRLTTSFGSKKTDLDFRGNVLYSTTNRKRSKKTVNKESDVSKKFFKTFKKNKKLEVDFIDDKGTLTLNTIINLEAKSKLEKLPSHFPESEKLNQRTIAGAKE